MSARACPTSVAGVRRAARRSTWAWICAPEIAQQFRAGDIRHCYADIGKIQRLLGYQPSISFTDGLDDLVAWARDQRPDDGVERATRELAAKALIQ